MDFYGFYTEAVPFYNFYQPESFYTFYSFSSLEVGKVRPSQLVTRRSLVTCTLERGVYAADKVLLLLARRRISVP